MQASERSWPMAADLYGELLLEQAPPARRRVRDYLPGASVTAIAALAAAWLADHYAAPIVLMGLLIGLSLSFLSPDRSEEHPADLQSLMGISLTVFCL